MNEIRVKVEGGYLIATKSEDVQYPGIDIEFIPDNDTDDNPATRPRVLFEKPQGEPLTAMIWGNRESEDYTDKIIFNQN